MIVTLDESTCVGCGVCVEICPMDVLRIKKEVKKAFIKYPDDCQTCYQCEISCKCRAIIVDSKRKSIPQPL